MWPAVGFVRVTMLSVSWQLVTTAPGGMPPVPMSWNAMNDRQTLVAELVTPTNSEVSLP